MPEPEPAEFEDFYRSVGDDLERLPWALLEPRPALVAWLDAHPRSDGRALVIGCGLGDDAEELSRRGYRVSAFDVSPTAVGWCRPRFPGSTVDYRVADLTDLPSDWQAAFDLVVEITTIQSIPLEQRATAIAAIASTVAPGGELFVRGIWRPDDARVYTRPWPVSHAELNGFVAAGLREVEFAIEPGGTAFRAVYARF